MPKVDFFVEMKPVGKARPRFDSRSRMAYTPKATHQAEAIIAKNAKLAMTKAGIPMASPEEAVCLAVTMYHFIPKSWTKKDKERALAGLTPCTKKPDLDNSLKLIMDAMNGILYADDKQVTETHVFKLYNYEKEGFFISASWGVDFVQTHGRGA